MKILIIGHKRHGKDTAAEIMREMYGLTYMSSSQAAADIFIYDRLKDVYDYKSEVECFNDRINRRAEWFNLISDYNREDPARLAKEIISRSDVYVGMRSWKEIDQCIRINLFDLIIGVYDHRRELESADSFDIDLWRYSDIVVPNSGTIEDLKNKIGKLCLKR